MTAPKDFASRLTSFASGSTDRRHLPAVLGAVGVAVAATTAAGTVATIPNASWFKRLDKPAWQPPNGLFGPVWTALYADIAVTSSLRLAELLDEGREDEARRLAVALGLNLALNGSWSWVFWQLKALGPATGVAAALAASSADLVRRVGRGDRRRSAALVPYAAWTTFATVLSAELWRRNR